MKIKELEARYIAYALIKHKTKESAAKFLGISTRKLRYKKDCELVKNYLNNIEENIETVKETTKEIDSVIVGNFPSIFERLYFLDTGRMADLGNTELKNEYEQRKDTT